MVSAVNNIFTMCVQVFSLDAKIVAVQLKVLKVYETIILQMNNEEKELAIPFESPLKPYVATYCGLISGLFC